MKYELEPIGYVSTETEEIPLFYTDSDVEGRLILDHRYTDGIRDLQKGQKIFVLFLFHESPPFDNNRMRVTPPHREEPTGVFNTRSPVRPNPIGLSLIEVLDVEENIVKVKGLDMIDGTPIIDIKSSG